MGNRKNLTLTIKLMIYSALVVFIAILIMAVLFTLFLNRGFKDYVRKENQEIQNTMVDRLKVYFTENSEPDQDWMEEFSQVYMDQGMFISLNSEKGELLWSCIENNGEMCDMHGGSNLPESLDHMETSVYELSEGSSKVYLNIRHNPMDDFSGNDLSFLFQIYNILLISMVLSLGFSFFTTLFFSRSFRLPLAELSGYAVRLSNHDYRARDNYRGGIREIDELHQAIENLAASLEHQESLRIRLTSDISHELRTPLTKIQTALEAMIDGIWKADEERLTACHGEILRLSGLVEKLSDLHSYDEERRPVNREPVKLKSSIISILNLYEKDFHDRRINTELTGEDAVIRGDENQLKQVWINLISNSLKFMKDGGNLTIHIQQNEGVRIVFSDDGEGIDQEDLPNVFERFYKGHSSKESEGTGLGLSIVREIITLHGGTISVESQKGRQTVFTIILS